MTEQIMACAHAGYKGKGYKEKQPSGDFGLAIEEMLAADPEPDTQELEDAARFMAQAPTANLSARDPKHLASTVAAAMGLNIPDVGKLPCGCKPGVGVCLGQRDLAERIRRGKRRATIRGDRGPLREAQAELREHIAEQRRIQGQGPWEVA